MSLGSVFLRASRYAAILIVCAGSWNQRVLWGQTLTGSQTPSTLEVSGRVVDARNGQPIARALVHMSGRAVLSDHDGIFHFPAVTATAVSFDVSKPGYYSSADGDSSAQKTIRLPSTNAIELILYPESIITGSAVNASGEGMDHLTVVARRSVFDENIGHHWQTVGQTMTSGDGAFRIPVPGGIYSIQVTQRGRSLAGKEMVMPISIPPISSSVAEAIHLNPGQEMHVDLRPEARKSHEVTLLVEPETRGFPILTAVAANGLSIPLSPVPTRRDEQNLLRVPLPSGSYILRGTMQNQDGLLEAELPVTVSDSDLTGVTLRFAPAPSLPVVVETEPIASDSGLKPPDALQLGLTMIPSDDSTDVTSQTYRPQPRQNKLPAFTLRDGAYRLRTQFSGSWVVTSATCGGLDLLTQSLPVSTALSGTEVRVRVSNQTASITGTVHLLGVPGAAWVYLLATFPSASPVIVVRSNADGTFFRPYLAAGSYRAVALESKITGDVQSATTFDRFLDRVQTFSVSAGQQRTLNLVAVPEQELRE